MGIANERTCIANYSLNKWVTRSVSHLHSSVRNRLLTSMLIVMSIQTIIIGHYPKGRLESHASQKTSTELPSPISHLVHGTTSRALPQISFHRNEHLQLAQISTPIHGLYLAFIIELRKLPCISKNLVACLVIMASCLTSKDRISRSPLKVGRHTTSHDKRQTQPPLLCKLPPRKLLNIRSSDKRKVFGRKVLDNR